MNVETLRRLELALMAVVGLANAACGGGGGGGEGGLNSPTAPTLQALAVTFEYRAPTEIHPDVDFDTCTTKQVRFNSHLHFTWNDWEDRRYLKKVDNSLATYTGEVPVGREVKIALHDPNTCLNGDVYVAPEDLYANGILLRRVVDVDEGTGLAFRQQSDGTIVP